MRIEVTGAAESTLRQLADDVGVLYEPEPSAWVLATMSGSVQSFLQTQAWEEHPDLNWPRADFDPVQLRFSGRQDVSQQLVLSRYQDPNRGRWLYWIWRGRECAEINDPAWGRYAILASRAQSVLHNNPLDGTVTVPATVPLPRLLARAFVLSTGYAPSSLVSGARSYQSYKAVPPDVYRVVSAKLGMNEGETN
jgi:hypothetical protein